MVNDFGKELGSKHILKEGLLGTVFEGEIVKVQCPVVKAVPTSRQDMFGWSEIFEVDFLNCVRQKLEQHLLLLHLPSLAVRLQSAPYSIELIGRKLLVEHDKHPQADLHINSYIYSQEGLGTARDSLQ